MATPTVEPWPASVRPGRPTTPPPAPGRSLGYRRIVRELGLALITAGVIVLLFVAYQLFGTNLAEQASQNQLAREFQHALAQGESNPRPAAAPAPAAGPSRPVANAIDHLVIPKIGVDKYVVQGVDEADLQMGPGHYPQTVMPGQIGNAGIAGHRTTFGAPFFRLNELAAGDPIELTNTAGRTFTYKVVRSEVVPPTDVGVLDNTPGVAQLTLTTCNPRFEAISRLVVVARLAADEHPLPAPPPAQVASSTPPSLGQGNGGAWPAVAGLGAAVLVAWILVRLLINRTRRWARVGAYVGGIAVCLVPLWFLFENVTRLLPSNI
ncbi:MAG TPA: class E sortase [Acidimicrobiales bacterium]|nr:class E sortase [Acidimicrobiales bacterium]